MPTRRSTERLPQPLHGDEKRFNGKNWTNSINWGTDERFASWHGVTTDYAGRVVSLHLYSNNLTGPIPAELDRLSNLRVLHLYGNHLTGPLPHEVGNLSNLWSLFLEGNNLTGPLPSSLTDLQQLQHLQIDNNAGLCAPADEAFQAWLATVSEFLGDTCGAADDTPLVVTLTADPMEIDEGGTSMITATANRAVTVGDGDVEIELTVVGDGTLDAASITIAAGAMSGSAMLTATEDDDMADETVTVVATGSGITGLMQVTVAVTDNDAAEPVPALPLIGQLLLGLGLLGGGARQLYRRRPY